MLLNYLRLALRILIRNPFFTFINVLGLSVGFAVFFMLWHHSESELSSDQYHTHSDRIACIAVDWQWTDDGKHGGQVLLGHMSAGTTYQISRDFPEIESILRILHQPAFDETLTGHGSSVILSHQQKNGNLIRFREERAIYADANLFEFFSIPLIYGQRGNILAEKNSVVLSAQASQKFFGNRNPIGELLTLNGAELLKVTGVFQDLPRNSHLVFDLVISNRSREDEWNTAMWSGTNCYVKLKHGDFAAFEKMINSKLPVYWAEPMKTLPHVKTALVVQPLTEIAFSKEVSGNFFRLKSRSMLLGLAAVSVAVLLMAWVNYVNLTISRTNRRTKEVATRKMSGAVASDLIKQFVTEAFVVNLISAAVAATLIQVMKQPAKIFLDIHLPAMNTIPLATYIFFGAVLISGILFTGLYPALLSVFHNPRDLFLMGGTSSGKKLVPAVLTTAQYASAIVLIFFGLILHQQLDHILNKDLGFDKENVLVINAPIVRGNNYSNDLRVFASEASKHPGVQKVTMQSGFINLGIKVTGKNIFINTNGFTIDEHYLSLYHIPVLAGRDFVADDRANVVILTRYAAERLNFKNPSEAIGSSMQAGPNDQKWTELEIIGVVENFKTTSFYSSPNNTEAETGRGVAFMYGGKAFPEILPETVMIKLKPESTNDIMVVLERKFNDIFPGNVFNASFLDDQISDIYHNEKLSRNQLTFFTGLAIAIACLGVLGMITNKVVEKKREIAIRKTMGAGTQSIGSVLLSNTIKQILIAILVATPAAYYFSQQYLERFTDRIALQWWHFALPITLLLFIMLTTVSYVLSQAVRTNPVDSLRQD